MAGLLDDTLGGNMPKGQHPNSESLKKLVVQGRRLADQLADIQARYKTGNELLTAKELFKRLTQRSWKLHSVGALSMKLTRWKVVPYSTGGKGRGNATRWWLFDVERALHEHGIRRDYQ